MVGIEAYIIAFFFGIVPALLWLWFWLQEDRLHPEPRVLVGRVFIAGMVAMAPAIIIQFVSRTYLGTPTDTSAHSVAVMVVWAAAEEISKFLAAFIIALRTRENDEPVDNMIYLITAALGFAALENSFYLLDPLGHGSLLQGLATGNLRFFGSTLLHVLSSGVIGVALAFAFFKRGVVKEAWIAGGLILAIGLHVLFNFLILSLVDQNILGVFAMVWIGILVLLLFFERVKHIRRATQ